MGLSSGSTGREGCLVPIMDHVGQCKEEKSGTGVQLPSKGEVRKTYLEVPENVCCKFITDCY